MTQVGMCSSIVLELVLVLDFLSAGMQPLIYRRPHSWMRIIFSNGSEIEDEFDEDEDD